MVLVILDFFALAIKDFMDLEKSIKQVCYNVNMIFGINLNLSAERVLSFLDDLSRIRATSAMAFLEAFTSAGLYCSYEIPWLWGVPSVRNPRDRGFWGELNPCLKGLEDTFFMELLGNILGTDEVLQNRN
ncbi:MAG: hypothetical protein LBD41_03505 [Clostridiales Family XIII bacterium]|jgi:hypothetical protein|nr:hypothetical protein [Clostridiales Family XIII bacterium]